MTLNPVQFGTEVIDQFGRFLRTTFPFADRGMEEQVREQLRHDVGGERLIAKGPYVYLNAAFEPGPSVAELLAEPDLGLHPVLPRVFPFDTVHKHQEEALRAVKAGRHTVVATGTGSGKTESFLLPVIDHALHLRDGGVPPGVCAVVVYPMNALADDQLRRLRPLLAGTGVTFGRYTGATPRDGAPECGRLAERRPYTAAERRLLEEGREDKVPLPWEECFSRQDIRERRPRVLLTNYSMLEYLLLRHEDLDLFRDAPLRFLVLDEVHTYTGALGSEVAMLVRRIRHVAGRTAESLLCIGTSATVQDGDDRVDGRSAVGGFAARLFGVPGDAVELVTERYARRSLPPGELFHPPPPPDPRGLLDELLAASRALQLQDEVSDLPEAVLSVAERLSGRAAPSAATVMQRASDLLVANGVLALLAGLFVRPRLLSEALAPLRTLGRDAVADDDLQAEILAYLTLGALVQRAGDPILRPKLHYFVQGFQGLGCSLDADHRPRLHFEAETREDAERVFTLALCRSCGQHYFPLIAPETVALDGGGVAEARIPRRDEKAAPGERAVYVTPELIGRDEADDDAPAESPAAFLCRFCGALHDRRSETCLAERCGRAGPLVPVFSFPAPMKTCAACGTAAKGFEEIVTPVRSGETMDVTILAQTMLSAMREPALRKLLVFTDNRQDAAFQAGWMEDRSRRFRLRHLLYAVLAEDPAKIRTIDALSERMADLAVERRILKEPTGWDRDRSLTRIRWFLLEEFASTGQRRNSLETLALAEVRIWGIGPHDLPGLYDPWAPRLGVTRDELAAVARLILDYYRRRGVVSDPLLRRRWTERDDEVRTGLVAIWDQYRPQALVWTRDRDEASGCVKGWTARNGRSGAQEILRKAIPGGAALPAADRDRFLDDLWESLIAENLLEPVELVEKRAGKSSPIHVVGRTYQINVEKLGFTLTDRRMTCPSCRRAQAAAPPTGACPEYGCKGTLEERGRETDHFDVYQYTRTEFVPLRPREHSAQVPRAEREKIEREFKQEDGGEHNCLVCTPTLELGVDIGKLEMVLMRNVPPTPANYAQRAGRAGRRHRIAVVFTYASGNAHGRYFFRQPDRMIAGEIRVPAFSMRNEPLIRKHAHSAILTTLRGLAASDEDRAVLERAFPRYHHDWYADRYQDGEEERMRYLPAPRDLEPLERLVRRHRPTLVETLGRVFGPGWPEEDRDAVSPERLAGLVEEFTGDLGRQVRALFDEVAFYRGRLGELRREEDAGIELSESQRTEQRRYRHALGVLNERRLENYALSRLAVTGFFPGYALSRDTVLAQCLEPFLELSRPAPVGLRELTPANRVYADRNVLRVHRVRFDAARGGDATARNEALERPLRFDPATGRVFERGTETTEGGRERPPVPCPSYPLAGVELSVVRDIDDRETSRRTVPFAIHGTTLERHGGGSHGRLGRRECRVFRRQEIRLVNLGVGVPGGAFLPFPICTACGAARTPLASEGELESFVDTHRRRHGRDTVGRFGLFVEFASDTIHFGPFERRAEAVNLFEAVRIGARLVLDMGTTEVEGFVMPDERGASWAVLYDPMPGGAGYLPQIVHHWTAVAARAAEALENCPHDCERACYACLLHFRNQQDHGALDRRVAVALLAESAGPLELGHAVPPVMVQAVPDAAQADSDAELDFAGICRRRGFPVPPAQQYRVELGDGGYTLADWAYPEKKVLVFIDGMSRALHGDPRQRATDRVKRAKAKLRGFQVVEMTAQELTDEGALSVRLEELAVYLGG